MESGWKRCRNCASPEWTEASLHYRSGQGDQIVKAPIGTIKICTRRKGGPWTIIKVAHPSVWRPLARVVWEHSLRKIPPGFVLWFKNRVSTDCRIENLELITEAERCKRNWRENYETWLARNSSTSSVRAKKIGLASMGQAAHSLACMRRRRQMRINYHKR